MTPCACPHLFPSHLQNSPGDKTSLLVCSQSRTPVWSGQDPSLVGWRCLPCWQGTYSVGALSPPAPIPILFSVSPEGKEKKAQNQKGRLGQQSACVFNRLDNTSYPSPTPDP